MQRQICSLDLFEFVRHCWVEDKAAGGWLPFNLWDSQRELLTVVQSNRFSVALKARQLGWTWVILAYALWILNFRQVAVLLFSQRDEDAQELMRRLSEMHARLPDWLRAPTESEPTKHEINLQGGSQAKAFSTAQRAGRSYTAAFVLIDEADHIPRLQELLTAVKPTVDAGGQLVLLSTSDKAKPASIFKSIYRAAKSGENNYAAIFHGWSARPGRTSAWHEREMRACLAQTGALDDLHQEYPATDTEALAPRSLDKRMLPAWVESCYRPQPPLAELPESAPSIPDFVVYSLPKPGRRYVLGADPAEGNPTSDDSAAVVLDAIAGEEVATLVGRIQPSVFAEHLNTIARWYNNASALIERNNHGHAVLLWLEANSRLPLLTGHDDRAGWLSSMRGKALLYEACADAFRRGEVVVHSFATVAQLQSIEGSTLRAPEGEKDDRADAFALALVAILAIIAGSAESEHESFTIMRT